MLDECVAYLKTQVGAWRSRAGETRPCRAGRGTLAAQRRCCTRDDAELVTTREVHIQEANVHNTICFVCKVRVCTYPLALRCLSHHLLTHCRIACEQSCVTPLKGTMMNNFPGEGQCSCPAKCGTPKGGLCRHIWCTALNNKVCDTPEGDICDTVEMPAHKSGCT